MTSILKKFAPLFAITAIFLSFGVSFAATQDVSAMAFSDVSSGHPNKDAVAYLKSENVIHGYESGEYKPDNTINRAEFMKIVIAASVKNPSGANCFKDVGSEWFAKYICEAKKRGLVSGYPDGTFRPGLNINLVEASKIVANAMIDGDVKSSSSSSAGAELWYKPYVIKLQNEKAIPVSIDYPEKKITRGEMAEMTFRVKADIENKPTKTFESLVDPLPSVSSCAELEEKFALQNYRNSRAIGLRRNLGAEEADTIAAPATAPTNEAMGEASVGAKSGDDFSSTNVQVEGVDEADIVKNDASYVYLMKERSIRIVKAVPVSEMKEVSRVVVDSATFYPQEMYVTGDRLVVVGSNYDTGSKTEVHIFDIADRTNVKKFRSFSFEGSYVSSRRIGNYAYFVMNSYPQYSIMNEGDVKSSGDTLIPKFTDSADGKTVPVVPCSSIRIFPRYDVPNIMVVAGVPLQDGNAKSVRQAFLGSGSMVYSSLENLYVATAKHQYDDMQIYDIWIPPVRNVSTVFHRFALKDGNVEYKTTGEVEGSLLNQFSMDESGEAFRATTTVGEFWGGGHEPNNQLYILDRDNLGTVLGKVPDIGKGEKVKSVRFMGRRAYVVTFKNTDPFYVIDVGNPRAPKILGELKLPGYSDYLHPYDENHIIGFGKDAVDVSSFNDLDDGFLPGPENFAWYQGMKLAMFDVSNPSAPKEMFHEVIGDRGTNSELLYNHKALLFSASKNLIAFPIEIAEIKDKDPSKARPDTYGEVNFRGAVVYSVDLEKGFSLKGKLTHVDADDFTSSSSEKMIAPGAPYFSSYDSLIKRLITIGNNLYAISLKKVTAHAIPDLTELGGALLEKESNL